MKTIRLSLRNVLGITLMATAIVAVSSTSAHAQLVWDLRNDFSLTGSPTATESDGIGPDGAWSFHMDDDGTEVLFDDTGESKFSGGDLLPPDQAWNSTLGGADPNNLWVAKADIAGTDTPSGDAPTGFDILAGESTWLLWPPVEMSSYAGRHHLICKSASRVSSGAPIQAR